MNRYYVMTILKDKGGQGKAWRCAATDPLLTRDEAMELVEKYRKNWDCLAAWVQLFEDDECKKRRIIYSECNHDAFGKWEEALQVTHEEAQKIFSAYCNGVEYPFGETDENGYRVVKFMKKAEYHAGLLDEAIRKQIAEKPECIELKNERGETYALERACPRCGNYESFTCARRLNYCPCCGQKLDWSNVPSPLGGGSNEV